MSLFHNIAGSLLGAINTGYNLYTNKRDFDYQKALQQQIFQREDNAVQRRMQDLEAAGLNPNLAAGSAADAGSVVSRSNTNDVNFGSMLDNIQAINQIKQQKAQNDILNNQRTVATNEAASSMINTLLMFGYDPAVKFNFKNQSWNIDFDENGNGNNTHYISGSPLKKYFDYELNNTKNSADILQKQNNWFTTNQILNAASSVIGDVAEIGGLFKPKFYKGRYQK